MAGFNGNVPNQMRYRIISANQRGVLETDLVFQKAKELGDENAMERMRHRRMGSYEYAQLRIALSNMGNTVAENIARIARKNSFSPLWTICKAKRLRLSPQDLSLLLPAARKIEGIIKWRVPFKPLLPLLKASGSKPREFVRLLRPLCEELACYPNNSPEKDISMKELGELCSKMAKGKTRG